MVSVKLVDAHTCNRHLRTCDVASTRCSLAQLGSSSPPASLISTSTMIVKPVEDFKHGVSWNSILTLPLFFVAAFLPLRFLSDGKLLRLRAGAVTESFGTMRSVNRGCPARPTIPHKTLVRRTNFLRVLVGQAIWHPSMMRPLSAWRSRNLRTMHHLFIKRVGVICPILSTAAQRRPEEGSWHQRLRFAWNVGSSWLWRPIEMPAPLNEGFMMEASAALIPSERSKNPLLDVA
jgi:hypothetical protein